VAHALLNKDPRRRPTCAAILNSSEAAPWLHAIPDAVRCPLPPLDAVPSELLTQLVVWSDAQLAGDEPTLSVQHSHCLCCLGGCCTLIVVLIRAAAAHTCSILQAWHR
jgi:hypothetical protein